MLTMMEFKIDLSLTALPPEEMKRLQEEKKPFEITIDLPSGFIIRRINTRILQAVRTGIDPKTKQIGQYMAAEECVYMWAECDERLPFKPRHFYIVPTGYRIPSNSEYVGTFLLQAGQHVFHVYLQGMTAFNSEA
jgi:hypothetical protein